MLDIKAIIKCLDKYLERTNKKYLTATQANQILEKEDLLNDRKDRPGKPVRDLLRAYKIPHGYQDNKRRWYIPHSSNFEKGSLKYKIREIAFDINTEIQIRQSRLSLLQELRAKKYNLKKMSKSFFNLRGIKPKYSFHNGGIKEFQFNFGFESIGNEKYFRYGIAVNLRRGQSLHNPMEIFANKIKNFNQFHIFHKNHIDDLLMWYYDIEENRHTIGNQINIDKSLGREGNFFFIGKLLKKDPLKVDHTDINDIVNLFDKLMPLYEFVEFGTQIETENRIARICWNSANWEYPTGRIGKSKNHSHEKLFGFGHEEWLFDMDQVIDGHKYGFITPLRQVRNSFINKRLNLVLYSINAEDGKSYWIGYINNVEVIDREESLRVLDIYKSNGWWGEMEHDLINLKLEPKLVNEYMKADQLFNIRFKPAEIKNIFPEQILVDESDDRISSKHYVLLKIDSLDFIRNIGRIPQNYSFESGSKDDRILSTRYKKSFRQEPKEFESKHNKMLPLFFRYLKSKYGPDKIRKECPAFGRNLIDLVYRSTRGDIFYEVKTYNKLKTSMRVAIGQLLEYCLYPDQNNAKKLILVSDIEPNKHFESYISQLNKYLKIPIGYIQFDMEENKIVTEI